MLKPSNGFHGWLQLNLGEVRDVDFLRGDTGLLDGFQVPNGRHDEFTGMFTLIESELGQSTALRNSFDFTRSGYFFDSVTQQVFEENNWVFGVLTLGVPS